MHTKKFFKYTHTHIVTCNIQYAICCYEKNMNDWMTTTLLLVLVLTCSKCTRHMCAGNITYFFRYSNENKRMQNKTIRLVPAPPPQPHVAPRMSGMCRRILVAGQPCSTRVGTMSLRQAEWLGYDTVMWTLRAAFWTTCVWHHCKGRPAGRRRPRCEICPLSSPPQQRRSANSSLTVASLCGTLWSPV